MAINSNYSCSPKVDLKGGVFNGRGWKAHKSDQLAVRNGSTSTVKLNAIQEIGNFTDPFSKMSAPSVAASGLGVCVSHLCSPGVYSKFPEMNSGTYTFKPGDYVFNTPVIIGGKGSSAAEVHFGAGNYNFAQGLIESGKASVNFASGTAIFSGAVGVCTSPDMAWNPDNSRDDADFNSHIANPPDPRHPETKDKIACSKGPDDDGPLDSTTIAMNGGPALSVFGHARLTSGDAKGGMLFYIASGAMSINTSGPKNGQFGDAVTLNGNSKFNNIAIWDNATASSGPALLGASRKGSSYSFGGVYIPNQKTIISQKGILQAAFMVLDSIKVLGKGTLSIG